MFLAVFAVLPVIVLGASVGFAMWDQDRRRTYIVQLQTGCDLSSTIEAHHRVYGVEVMQSWPGNRAPGYRATIPKRCIAKLVGEPLVASVTVSES